MKLSPLTIYLIGLFLALPIICFGWFYNKMPNDADAANYRAVKEQNDAEAAKQSQADKRVATALQMIRAKEAEWRQILATRTPPSSVRTGGISLAVNGFQLTEDTRKYRNSIQRDVNAQLRKGGVKVINGPLVPVPDANAPANSLLASFYNYPTIPFPVVIFDLGTVTVQGTRQQIMDHVRAYKTMPRYLAVTDGLRLDGTSPILTGTYNLTIVGYIPAKTVYGAAPEGAVSGTGGGGGGGVAPGGFGGAPGGFGPPGGGRGPSMGGPSGPGGPTAAGMQGGGGR